jgi:transposase InsO family protein
MLALGALLFLLLTVVGWIRLRTRPRALRRRPGTPKPDQHAFGRKKPEWVARTVVRLKAVMPHAGCRQISIAFNTRHGHKGESVGKSYVATVIKRRALAILNLRKKLKNRVTRQGPRNLTWAADLSFLPEKSQPVLGILDHGTRASLHLAELRTRSTIAILRVLLDLFERFGRPKFFRTDNESIFSSPILTGALWTLGIRHQRTDPFCPWQNGRIERFFGTFKERILRWWEDAGLPSEVQPDLDVLRTWYNHVRPHQGLGGLTPAEAWAGRRSLKPLRYFSAWNGILAGFGRPT